MKYIKHRSNEVGDVMFWIFRRVQEPIFPNRVIGRSGPSAWAILAAITRMSANFA